MSTNAFYCPRCGKFTRHCKLSLREFGALNGDGFVGKVLGLWGDVTGLTHLTGLVCDFSFWKCMECGLATSRNVQGEVKNIAKNS